MSVGLESGFSSEELLSLRFPLHRACRDGDVSALCALLLRGPEQLAVEDSFYGWTPLHWAAHFGKLECVMRLMQVGCGVNSVTSRFSQTPAHIAAFGGHPQCLLWLLQAGADTNRQDYVGETPLHKAARAGSTDCINTLLVQGAKPDLRNASGLTAADLAHAQGFQECAQLLSNAQNQQFSTNGSMCFGVPTRKRSLDCMEPNRMKKARTDDLGHQRANNSREDEPTESMHMEFGPALSSTGGNTPLNGFFCSPEQERGLQMESASSPVQKELEIFTVTSMQIPSGLTLDENCHPVKHLNGGGLKRNESSTVPENGDHSGKERVSSNLQCSEYFGHCNGFGDTAESMEDGSSQIEHSKSVSAEEQYDYVTFATMHLYHGC